jgi:competence protein ComEC
LADNVGIGASTYELEVLGQKNTVRYSILDKIRGSLRYGLNNLNGEMIYSAMFGDRTDLNHGLYDAYKSAGVAHLLAVSGLHVGLVVAILNWLMKKCKIKGWWRLGIIAPLLFGYAYLCGFSYSIIRASIMALVLMIAPLLFSEYDLLSSICFAGALILLMEPIALFSLSAQLSFSCVFGIAMLYPIFKRWLSKIHIQGAIADSFCISLATIISTLPFMAYYFNEIQPIGLISNIIIIPIFGILFTITFIVAMLSMLLPFISYALILINPLFEWLNWAIIFISNNAKALPMPSVNYLTIILFCTLLAFASKFNIKKGINKLTWVGICSCILALQMALI